MTARDRALSASILVNDITPTDTLREVSALLSHAATALLDPEHPTPARGGTPDGCAICTEVITFGLFLGNALRSNADAHPRTMKDPE